MSQTAALPKAAQGDAGPARPWLTLLAVSLGVIMVMLDGTVVSIANPVIQAELGASLADIQWVTSGYLLALAVFLITAGKLGDIFGHKRVFLIGVVGFALTSLAIGLTSSIGPLIAFRVLQGLFGALLQPAALALLRMAFPGDRLNMAMGAWGGIIGLSSAAGPIVGGLLVEHVSWQSVFFINVPVGVVALGVGWWALRESKATLLSKVDWLGVVFLSIMMFSLVWAIIKAPEWGWGDTGTLISLGVFVVFLVAFLWWQTRVSEPLVPLGLFRNASFSVGVTLMILTAFSMFGAMFFLTFFFQGVHGLSPLESGVRMLPMSAGMIVASPLAGILIGKLGPRIMISGGMLITAVAMFLMSRLSVDAAFLDSAIPFALLAFGLSPVFVGATEIIVGNAPEELSGVAGGLQQSAMQVGGALGTAILGAIVAAKVSSVYETYLGPAAQGFPPDQLEGLKEAASYGVAPTGLPEQIQGAVTNATHFSFMDGLHLGFEVSAGVAVFAALIALLVRAGRKIEGEPVHIG
ncbi:DHA2 family efflux MFS transporter permease subunit [Herbidospora mongoliensis]|uniref:DHA2 family efflux MFS transporter permease subunit n=1 Tax=Herbidospora mongoliensis TaxID=688067 RepID=UPI00082E54EE|nr:DHA2 family efflux MFS transporter permease subunit [Herbidospora mongoliensis]